MTNIFKIKTLSFILMTVCVLWSINMKAASSVESMLVTVPAASKDLPLREMLTCSTPEEAHTKSLHFMNAHIENLTNYVGYLESTSVSSRAKYDSLALRYRRITNTVKDLRPMEMEEVVERFLGNLKVDLSLWGSSRDIFITIYKYPGYSYNPENDITALDALYIKAFEDTVKDVIAEKEGRLPCAKLSYEAVNAYIESEEARASKHFPTEEPFDFIYSWNLARMLRPFLSPIYLNIERMDPFQAIYIRLSSKPGACHFRLDNVYAFVSDSINDMLKLLGQINSGERIDIVEEFLERAKKIAKMPFVYNARMNGRQTTSMTAVLKKKNKKIAAEGASMIRKVYDPEAVGSKGDEWINDAGGAILWKPEKGFFTTGYKEWMGLLEEISSFVQTLTPAAEVKKGKKGKVASVPEGDLVKAPIKVVKGKKGAEEEDLDELLAEASAQDSKAKATEEAALIKAITLRLVEAQQRVSSSWREDLEAFTRSLTAQSSRAVGALKVHAPEVRGWVSKIVEADRLTYKECESMLLSHFGLYNRGGSMKGLKDPISHAIGFFHAPHAAEDGHQDRGALWRKNLQAFFERAGLYEEAASGAGRS